MQRDRSRVSMAVFTSYRTSFSTWRRAGILKRELRYLNLYGTAITDRGLEELVHLSSLEAVYLWQTEVTAAGLAALRKTLPASVIHHQPVLPPVSRGGNEADEDSRRRRRGKKKDD